MEKLNKEDEVYAMGLRGSKSETYKLLWIKWHNQRIKKKVVCKMLFSERDPYYDRLSKLKYTQVRLIKGITPSAITILKDKVLIFTFGDQPSCLSISNQEISQSLKTFFNTLWKIAKP